MLSDRFNALLFQSSKLSEEKQASINLYLGLFLVTKSSYSQNICCLHFLKNYSNGTHNNYQEF